MRRDDTATPPAIDISAAKAPADAGRVTPMMAQYVEIKAANPDCLLFYRMGDFYELFFQDAEIASRTLGIVLTKRGKHLGEDIKMCGVPVERADDYLQRLIAAGHRVAVCEQTEDPAEAKKRGGKSVVQRDVVRLVTPGTITEERLLEPGRASLLVAVARRKLSDAGSLYGLAAVDISTGRFSVLETPQERLAVEFARLEPREIVCPEAIHDDPELREFWRELTVPVTPLAREGLDAASAERRLKEFFGVATLDAFGAFSRAEIAAAGAALAYVERTQFGARPPLSPPVRDSGSATMLIDAATRANLELTRTLSGERTGSLLSAIDRTVTPGGARLIAERLAGPLTDPAAIAARHDAVEALVTDTPLRDDLRRDLARVPDIARALARLSLDRGGPRDLAALGAGLTAARDLAMALSGRRELPRDLALAADALAQTDATLPLKLTETLADELPLNKRDGRFVRDGHDAALDELRLLQVDSRKVIAQLQARYANETGCRTLRIKHNSMLGYFVEVPQAVGEDFLKEPWRATFVHRQTMSDAMRFSSVELGELESKIASAADRALKLELTIFAALTEAVLAEAEPVKTAALALAEIDVTAALAELAASEGWTRPLVDEGTAFAITAGRHPVVEAALKRDGKPFVANDSELSPPDAKARGGRICLITGPNMAGKSTFLRQNALIAVLAQMGAFVPASQAHIGVVDRLFSRVGAADDLARGRSTFMVEMVETAAILNQAGPRALVILDEIGRGTATFDGLSIAWAAIEHLHEINRCRSLFATHYHELTALGDRLDRVANATVRVTEWNGEVVFLHEVVPGAADRSYGIQVAKLAGLPPAVVERARAILGELEKTEREKPVASLVDDLPLFAAPVRRPAPVAEAAPAADALRDALTELDLDEMTPRQALEALYKLKGLS
ncbi:DNA mismatch repair protein MutS [Bosea sp. BK604]|uniref:DNA mismatch repair protein MutS n=1 Tax=Bosea sp. BK604 TaxID=2512180 RepID=UPI0020C052EE|nr:DNA mismatch repair protein MutS [Bosea sp. BK604]